MRVGTLHGIPRTYNALNYRDNSAFAPARHRFFPQVRLDSGGPVVELGGMGKVLAGSSGEAIEPTHILSVVVKGGTPSDVSTLLSSDDMEAVADELERRYPGKVTVTGPLQIDCGATDCRLKAPVHLSRIEARTATRQLASIAAQQGGFFAAGLRAIGEGATFVGTVAGTAIGGAGEGLMQKGDKVVKTAMVLGAGFLLLKALDVAGKFK